MNMSGGWTPRPRMRRASDETTTMGGEDYSPEDEESMEESAELPEGPESWSWEDDLDPMDVDEEDGAPANGNGRQRHEETRTHESRSRGARQVRGPTRMIMLGAQGEENRSETGDAGRIPREAKPRSEPKKEEARPLSLGTRTPKTINGRALDHWVETHAPSQAKDGPIVVNQDETLVVGAIMQQVTLKQGLKLWDDKAKASAMKEMQHAHDLSTFIPSHAKTLTKQERKRALCTIIFLKEKRDKRIKTWTCIDGSPQREYIPKEDAASPTAARDAIFIQSAVDAKEGQEVAYADMPGAFLHTKTDDHIIVLLSGKLCELMVVVNPKLYRKYVKVGRGGRPMLYVQLYKSVYGLLRSTLLFYRKFKRELVECGFKMNSYDPCTANMDTPLGQLTVQWHVDDVKASCKDGFEITKLFQYLDRIYGNKIIAHRGKKGEYLGKYLFRLLIAG